MKKFKKFIIVTFALFSLFALAPQEAHAQSDGYINIGLSPAQEKKLIANMSAANKKAYNAALKKNQKCIRGLIVSLGISYYVSANPKAAVASLMSTINGCI